MVYRTRTYIAGDWTGDQDLIQKLEQWNESDYLLLSFSDAHKITQARDASKPCSIKKSLATRLDASKTFVLIVGSETRNLTKGSCQYCDSYFCNRCYSGGYVDFRSFIEYECEKAKRDGLKIIVIYNYSTVKKEKCPDVLKDIGTHIPGYRFEYGVKKWNYSLIKETILGY